MKNLNVKKLFTSMLAIIMAIALVFGCVGCSQSGTNTNNDNDANNTDNGTTTDKYEGLSDAEYFQVLVEDALSGPIGLLASTIGNYADNGLVSGDYGASAEMTLLLGDSVLDLLGTYAGTMLGGEMDMSFLSEISLNAEINSNSGLTQFMLGLGLSETQIVALNLIMSETTLWAGATGLSDTFLEVNMDEVGFAVEDVQTEKLTELLSILPEEKEIDKILNRYLSLALKEIDKVERTQTTLELDGLKQDLTQLNVKLYALDFQDIIKVVLTTAKEDQNIKKIIDDITAFYNEVSREQSADWVDEDLYAEFIAAIDEALNGDIMADADKETYIDVNLYVNSKHDVVGMSITVPESDEAIYTSYTVTEGENFKELLEIVPASVKITGSGTNNKGVVNGKYDVAYQGTSYLTVELKDFATDWESVSGIAVLTPSEALMEMLNQSAQSIIPLNDIALELGFGIAEGVFELEAQLIGDDAMIVGMILKLADKASSTIEKPTNTVSALDQQALMTWVAGLDISSVFTNLRTAGVPENLVAMLEGLAQMAGI